MKKLRHYARLVGLVLLGMSTMAKADDFSARREKLYAELGNNVAVLAAVPEFFTDWRSHRYDPSYFPQEFKQEVFFYYLSSLEEPGAVLLIDGARHKTTLYRRSEATTPADKIAAMRFDAVRPRTDFASDMAALEGRKPAVYLLLGEGDEHIETGILIDSQKQFPEGLKQPTDRQQDLRDAIMARYPWSEVRNLDPLVARLRAVKDPAEIAIMREAGRETARAMIENIKSVAVGVRQSQLAGVSRFVCLAEGAQRIPYSEDIQTGSSALMSYWDYFGRYDKDDRALRDGELVYMDTACEHGYYQGDMARTVPTNGHFSLEQRGLYALYMKGYTAALAAIRPGATQKDVALAFVAAIRAAQSAGLSPLEQEGADDIVERYKDGVPLGHFVDMYVYGAGDTDKPMVPGQILTIEPSMFIKSRGMRITLEDLILITPQGHDILTDTVPRDMKSLEALVEAPGLLDLYRGAEPR